MFGIPVFTQNYSLNGIKEDRQGEWDGHCWIEIDSRHIFDISIIDTIKSSSFHSHLREQYLATHDARADLYHLDKNPSNSIKYAFKYVEKETLEDASIEAILQGVANYYDKFKK